MKISSKSKKENNICPDINPRDILVAFNPFRPQTDGLLAHCLDCDKDVCVVSSSCAARCKHEISPLTSHLDHVLSMYKICSFHGCYPASFAYGAYVHRSGTLIHVDTRVRFHVGMGTGKFRALFSNVPFGTYSKDYFVPSINDDYVDMSCIQNESEVIWCRLCARFISPCKLTKIWPVNSQLDRLHIKTLSKLHYEHAHGNVECSCNEFNCTCQLDDLNQVALRKMWSNMREDIGLAPFHIKCMADEVIKLRGGKIPTARRGKKYLESFWELWSKTPHYIEKPDICKVLAKSLVGGFMMKN